MRPLFVAVFLIALLAACTTPTTPATTSGAAVGTTSGDPTTTVSEVLPSPTTTRGSPDATTTTTPPKALFVVAEERMRRLTVLEETGGRPCDLDEPALCGPVTILTSIDLQYRPHNMTSAGAILWVTHPSEGKVTRIDLVDLTVVSQPLGVEPHDVKASNAGDILYVADEEGRAIILADPDTLEELGRIQTPARPHDLAVGSDGTVWLTMIGDDRLGRLRDGNLEFFPTGRSPHDL
ncbi:MAG: YncE family protein, partial [Acidimicrobiia bacterium]